MPATTSGKVGTAPCGHPGEHVIGNYVACGVRCHVRPTCRNCGSTDRVQNIQPIGWEGKHWACLRCSVVLT